MQTSSSLENKPASNTLNLIPQSGLEGRPVCIARVTCVHPRKCPYIPHTMFAVAIFALVSAEPHIGRRRDFRPISGRKSVASSVKKKRYSYCIVNHTRPLDESLPGKSDCFLPSGVRMCFLKDSSPTPNSKLEIPKPKIPSPKLDTRNFRA